MINNNPHNFIDRTAKKMIGEYNKDNLIQYLNNKLKKAELENGKLQSYIQELEYDIKNYTNNPEYQRMIDGRVNQLCERKNELLDKRQKEIKRLKESNKRLIAENIQLKTNIK